MHFCHFALESLFQLESGNSFWPPQQQQQHNSMTICTTSTTTAKPLKNESSAMTTATTGMMLKIPNLELIKSWNFELRLQIRYKKPNLELPEP